VRLEGLGNLGKKKIHHIGIRSRYLPACGIVDGNMLEKVKEAALDTKM
jgi:hypothetical protein